MQLSNILCQHVEKIIWSIVAIGKLKEGVKQFKKGIVELFQLRFQSGFYTLAFHLLEHIVEGPKQFKVLSGL